MIQNDTYFFPMLYLLVSPNKILNIFHKTTKIALLLQKDQTTLKA